MQYRKRNLTLAILLAGLVAGLNAQSPLAIPDTLSGSVITLEVDEGSVEFYPGITTQTMGVNGPLLGPTVILDQGSDVQLQVENNLSDPTTMHWHGLHVSPSNDGGPHTVIPAGTTWSPQFEVKDRAATYWYHPHLHEKTNEQVSKGVAGFIIVRDDQEALLELPRSYGLDDFPLVFQTKAFDAGGQIDWHSQTDSVSMVNGVIDPYLDVPAQMVRFRLLNGSSQRVFNLGLASNQQFYQIASDASLLEAPVAMTRLLLSPGERAEVLVDFQGMEGGNSGWISYASELPSGYYGSTQPGMMPMMTLDGYNPNPLNGNDFDLLDLQIVASTADPVISIPSSLVTLEPLLEADAGSTHGLTLSAASMGPSALNGEFLINGSLFDMSTINYETEVGSIEIWTIFNQSPIAHPFHIHGVPFLILDRNGSPVDASESGWKDVVMIPPMNTIRFITRFDDYSDDNIPYMYHCHMLAHEDDGMMGQFLVRGGTTGIGNAAESMIRIAPNPAGDHFRVIGMQHPVTEIRVIDMCGRVMKTQAGVEADVSDLAAGVYLIRIEHPEGSMNMLLEKN